MKKQKAKDPEEITLIRLAQEYADEDKAREYFESLFWPNGPTCPHCKVDKSICRDVYKITPDEKSKTRKGIYCCAACRKQFTVTVGTVFEGSHIPLSKWLMALFIMCSSKKSISSNQLHRMLGVTYKTAWFMTHRIRFAMTPNHWAEPKLKDVSDLWKIENELTLPHSHVPPSGQRFQNTNSRQASSFGKSRSNSLKLYFISSPWPF